MNKEAVKSLEQVRKGGMQATVALKTLNTVLGNIVNKPDEEKYRTLRLDNPKIQEKIGRVAGAVDLLKALGTPLTCVSACACVEPLLITITCSTDSVALSD